ncbi:MAG: type 3 dihydrofolate reductase [Pseudomonadota bacterium]
MQPKSITLVAAMGKNGVIGHDGDMPWHLPADLAHFKQLTMGHPVLMGRRTFESIGRALPGRRNLVVSRSVSMNASDKVEWFATIDDALQACENDELMVIGGGELYRQILPRAQRMELTLIDAEPEGDTRFPEWSRVEWQLHAMQVRPADKHNVHRLVFCSLQRQT